MTASPPDLLLERLQRAVAPDYRVERRLGEGGMGVVFLAHDVLLNVDVAIKVLRPELWTAGASEDFLREARILATLRHPNVVLIYRPGQGEGLDFYIMELIGGPTLEQRIESGPIPLHDVVKIGRDLLTGLEQVHRLGLVHRDIKPSNVFLLPDRALLGDFGIARPATDEDEAHRGEGTPDYMADEQVQRKPSTPRSDIYAIGVVLYEAVTGRGFNEQGDNVDWTGVPEPLATVLKRAVQPDPEARWTDAKSFRQALEAPDEPPIPPKVTQELEPGAEPPNPTKVIATIVGAVILVGGVAWWIISHRHNDACKAIPHARAFAPTVAFGPIDYEGPEKHNARANTLRCNILSDLGADVNFNDSASATLTVQAKMTVTGNDVVVGLAGGIPPTEFHASLDQLSMLHDSISYQIALAIWAIRSPLAGSLPAGALPRRFQGLIGFAAGEQFVAETQWERAESTYRHAELVDSSCWICAWRITDVARWRGHEPDPRLVRIFSVHADSLPPPYRNITLASTLPLRARLDTLRAVTEGFRDNFLGWFQLGDELFHRGPLLGHRRSEATLAFERAARLRPDYGPAWEHLAWVATAEGDSSEADNALHSLESHSTAPDPFSRGLRALLYLGFAWRFLPERAAAQITDSVAGDTATQTNPDFGAGPRLVPTFDAPRGAIYLGEILEKQPSHELQRAGLVGQLLGSVALGRMDKTRDLAGRLAAVSPETEIELFNAELPAALAFVDPGSADTAGVLGALGSLIASPGVDSTLRDRASWMSTLLGRPTPLRDAAPSALQLYLSADSLAASGRQRAAVYLLDQVPVDAATRIDPFLRAIVHLQRAKWRAQLGDFEGAKSELIWHEHLALVGLPTDLPQAAEVDWAFGTVARWRLARLLDRSRVAPAQRNDVCASYAAVARHWSGSPAPFGGRAEFARKRTHELKCERHA